MKNAFDGPINRLDLAEERISELEDISVETSKTWKQREKHWKKKSRTEYQRTVGKLSNVQHLCDENTKEEATEEKGTEDIFETTMTETFPNVMSNPKP